MLRAFLDARAPLCMVRLHEYSGRVGAPLCSAFAVANVPFFPDSSLLTLCHWHAVVASEKGVVVGRLQFREDGDLIDCQRMGVGGKAIPPNVDKVRGGGSVSCLSCICEPGSPVCTSCR